MGSETAMTITFSVGTLLSFLANRSLTFRHRGDKLAALRRFLPATPSFISLTSSLCGSLPARWVSLTRSFRAALSWCCRRWLS
jgi:putative flippase GtrA